MGPRHGVQLLVPILVPNVVVALFGYRGGPFRIQGATFSDTGGDLFGYTSDTGARLFGYNFGYRASTKILTKFGAFRIHICHVTHVLAFFMSRVQICALGPLNVTKCNGDQAIVDFLLWICRLSSETNLIVPIHAT